MNATIAIDCAFDWVSEPDCLFAVAASAAFIAAGIAGLDSGSGVHLSCFDGCWTSSCLSPVRAGFEDWCCFLHRWQWFAVSSTGFVVRAVVITVEDYGLLHLGFARAIAEVVGRGCSILLLYLCLRSWQRGFVRRRAVKSIGGVPDPRSGCWFDRSLLGLPERLTPGPERWRLGYFRRHHTLGGWQRVAGRSAH